MRYHPIKTRLKIEKDIKSDPSIASEVDNTVIGYGSASNSELEVSDITLVPKESTQVDKLDWLVGSLPFSVKIWDLNTNQVYR